MSDTIHHSPDAGRASDRRVVRFLNIWERETSEQFIERHYADRRSHRCKIDAEFDVERIMEDHGSQLVRSSHELEPHPEGVGMRAAWNIMVFMMPDNVFWHFSLKNTNTRSQEQSIYTVTVTANEPMAAHRQLTALVEKYTPRDDEPGFTLVKGDRNLRRIPLRAEYFLDDAQLALHYGEDFLPFVEQFASGLGQSGLSILRGAPGTGKTSFLRHMIHKLHGTHRFFYIPTDGFGLLHGSLVDFLRSQQRKYPQCHLVLVLEDAEALLANRHGFRDGLASSLLNFTDGFISDLVKAHMICTINEQFKELDEAVLRPGRQRFFHEFETIPWPRALALATKLGVTLTKERKYSLAEIYHFADLQNARHSPAETRTIGFN